MLLMALPMSFLGSVLRFIHTLIHLFVFHSLLQRRDADVEVVEAAEVVEMLLILAAVTIWEAAAEPLEVFTDQEADVVDVDVVLDLAAAVQMTGALLVLCAPTAKEVLVLPSLAQDVTLAVAQVLLSLVLSVLLSIIQDANAAKRRHRLESANGHACGLAAAPVLHLSLSSNL